MAVTTAADITTEDTEVALRTVENNLFLFRLLIKQFFDKNLEFPTEFNFTFAYH